MFNPFFDMEAPRREIPRRIYALYDQHAGERFLLEAIDANWFDNVMGEEANTERWLVSATEAPIFVLDTPKEIYQSANLESLIWDDEDNDGSSNWVQIDIDDGGGESIIYSGLFTEGMRVGLSAVRALTDQTASRLRAVFDLAPYISNEQEIRSALVNLSNKVEWVAVYDVGQGAANGLCCSRGAPLVYFDLGGGVLVHTSTFSRAFSNICFTYSPPVVLSHWDWDHWSSGQRFNATDLKWVAPLQNLGAVHATFAASIAKKDNLLIWPADLRALQIGQVTLEKCTGRSGRNNTGIAALVAGPDGEKPIMLPGDARYSAIPSGLADCHAVVVPHHGADMRNNMVPRCAGHIASRAAYSYGSANTFGHPCIATYNSHDAQAWPHRHIAPNRGIDLHTPDARPALGHIGLTWSAMPRPLLPCSNHCSLALKQQ
jgi:hypothetical protein